MREAKLARLGVDLNELDIDRVALLETCLLNRCKALPVDLADVE